METRRDIFEYMKTIEGDSSSIVTIVLSGTVENQVLYVKNIIYFLH